MSTTTTTAAAAAPPAAFVRTILHVAWMAIALGIGLELLLLLAAAGMGTFKTIQPFVADLVQKVAWATFVCVGLGFGKLASTLRPHLTGLLGFIAAPAGFNIARTLHKSTEKALGMASAGAAGASPMLLAGMKAFEYLCLGILVGWLARKAWGGSLAHFTAGLGIAIVFGGSIIGVADWYSPVPLNAAGFLARSINELIFPVGCAMVIYGAELLASQFRTAED